MMYAATAEPRLGNGETHALAAQHVVHRHADIVVAQIAFGAFVEFRPLGHMRRVADDFQSRRFARHDEHRHAILDRRLRIGHGQHQHERRITSIRREPLFTIDHPEVTVTSGMRDELLRVGTGLRLGHRKAGHDPAVEQRLQIPVLLRLGAEHRENFGVAGIRRRGPEHRRCPDRTADDFVHQAQLDLPIALAAQLGTEMTGPQSLLADLLLQGPQDRTRCLVLGVVDHRHRRKQHVEGIDLFTDKTIHPVQLGLKLRLGRKIPHAVAPDTFWVTRRIAETDNPSAIGN